MTILVKSWLDLDPHLQSSRLCRLFHSELVDVALKVYNTVSEHHAHIKIRARDEVVSKLVHVLRAIMDSLLNKVSSDRCTLQYRKFFGVSPSVLLNPETFMDHCALFLGDNVYSAFMCEAPRLTLSDPNLDSSASKNLPKIHPTKEWPTKVSSDFAKKCAARYREAYHWKTLLCCAVCARSSHDLSIMVYELEHKDVNLPKGFQILRMNEGHKHYDCPDFRFSHPALDYLMLARSGIKNPDQDNDVELNVCHQCLIHLEKKAPTVPRHALMNGLYVGELPDHLKDISWLEKQICALV